ncbi:hypothetical protein ACPF8X_36540 [Streptomyces sp. G35A]
MGGHAARRNADDRGHRDDPDGLDDLAVPARAALVREIDASGAFDADPVWREVFAARSARARRTPCGSARAGRGANATA